MNLLLVSVDSLRLDAVSRTRPQVRTPRFDRTGAGFAFCERCFSVSSATRPVHASLLTGLYPCEHGVLGQHHARMRGGIPHLFELARDRGFAVGGFSEAAGIFAGLQFAPWIAACPQGDLRPVEQFLQRNRSGPCLVFVHCWGAHTPYGAADGRAWGETWEMLKSGQIGLVRQRYHRAVERVFEEQLAPLLEQLDLRRWVVAIVGDHGQSWTAAEPYHGQTLENTVLRVPLYLHVPGTGNPPFPRQLASLVDVFPTLVALLDLPVEYRGYGCDLRREQGGDPYLAEVEPGPIAGDAPPADSPLERVGLRPTGRQWSVFDGRWKLTWDESRGCGRLQTTLGEEPVADPAVEARHRAYRVRVRAESRYAQLPPAEATEGQQADLDERLRTLGYL